MDLRVRIKADLFSEFMFDLYRNMLEICFFFCFFFNSIQVRLLQKTSDNRQKNKVIKTKEPTSFLYLYLYLLRRHYLFMTINAFIFDNISTPHSFMKNSIAPVVCNKVYYKSKHGIILLPPSCLQNFLPCRAKVKHLLHLKLSLVHQKK